MIWWGRRFNPVFSRGPAFFSYFSQWNTIASEEERNSFIADHTSVATNICYVMPDNICTQLLPVMRNRYITTTEKISYKNALELESLSTAEYPEQTENGNEYSIRFSTLQINSTITGNFIMQTSMIYGAVVLMVICLTVLSLQQLLDAGPYKYRFIAAIIVASVVIVLVILLLCYFISTWVIFRRSVHS